MNNLRSRIGFEKFRGFGFWMFLILFLFGIISALYDVINQNTPTTLSSIYIFGLFTLLFRFYYSIEIGAIFLANLHIEGKKKAAQNSRTKFELLRKTLLLLSNTGFWCFVIYFFYQWLWLKQGISFQWIYLFLFSKIILIFYYGFESLVLKMISFEQEAKHEALK